MRLTKTPVTIALILFAGLAPAWVNSCPRNV